MATQLAREEGLLVGILASAVIVTVLSDFADKYLSERSWEEA